MSAAWEQAKREAARARAAAAKAAMLLDRVGMKVVVSRGEGAPLRTKLASLPWTLGSGEYVAFVDGLRGPMGCGRIAPEGAPVRKAVAA